MKTENIEFECVSGEKVCARIEDFLHKVDKEILPVLSERVDICEYARKLACNAQNIFAILDGVDVGECSVYCNQEVAYISSIAVQQEHINKGIGSALMAQVKECVKNAGSDKIRLQVYKENFNAIRYYNRNGFKKQSEDEIWIYMECPL